VNLELGKVNRGQQLAAVGSVVLFVFLFIGWYSLGGAFGGVLSQVGLNASIKGWDAHTLLRWLMLLVIVGALGLAFLSASGREAPKLPVSPSALLTALAALTTIMLAFRMLIDQPGPDKYIDLKFGAWIALASLLAITVGGWMSMQSEGLSMKAAGEQFRSAVGSASDTREPSTTAETPSTVDETPPASAETPSTAGETPSDSPDTPRS
jgi:hypothetical protein